MKLYPKEPGKKWFKLERTAVTEVVKQTLNSAHPTQEEGDKSVIENKEATLLHFFSLHISVYICSFIPLTYHRT